MGFGAQVVYTLSMVSGGTLTSVALDLGRSWAKTYLEVPTMTSGDVYVQGAFSAAGPFRRISIDNGNTSSVQADFIIKSSVSQRFVPIPVSAFRFIKIENSSGVSQTTTIFNIICGDC